MQYQYHYMKRLKKCFNSCIALSLYLISLRDLLELSLGTGSIFRILVLQGKLYFQMMR